MGKRVFSREFKLEAVKLVKERGVTKSQAARDLGIHVNVLRKWVADYETDASQAFPGRGKMRDCLLREGTSVRFAFIAKHRGIWQVRSMCETRCLARRVLRVAVTAAEPTSSRR